MTTLLNKLYRGLTHPLLTSMIRWGIGGLFVLFSVSKALSPFGEFVVDIRAYQMLPEAVIPVFALLVMVAEIAFGALLIIGLFTRTSLYAISGLLVMFLIAITQGVVRGLGLTDCGCSGDIGWLKIFGETPGQVLWRDGVMLVGLVWLLVTRRYGWTLDAWLHRRHQSRYTEI
jgi:uncharacterized membrane protein YphA (DoxX/SURF4 family)